MSSSLQTALNGLFLNDYASVVVITAIAYDYALIFFEEIEYIWCKPWTWVSTLFVFIRYGGLCSIMCDSLVGTSFFPGPEKTYVLDLPSLSELVDATTNMHQTAVRFVLGLNYFPYLFQDEIVWIIGDWANFLFLCSADLTMLLRVWAMYNRSRWILVILLASLVFQGVSVALVNVIYSVPNKLSVYCNQILSYSYCGTETSDSLAIWSEITSTILQATNGTAICTLAIVKCTRVLLQTYRMKKRWELNQYMNMLIQQGVIYFVAILIYQLFNLLGSLNKLPSAGWQSALVYILDYVPIFTLAPRFVISMRKLYAQGVRREGSDGAFGLSTSRIGVESAIMFADVEQNGPEVANLEIQMETTEIGTSQTDPAV